MLLCRLAAASVKESTMTAFQKAQLTIFMEEQKFKKGCSDLREYERAKRYLLPWDRPSPIPDLDFNETISFIIDFLRV